MDELPPEIAAQNKGPTVLAVIYVVTALSTAFMAARVFTRSRILGKLHLDDYLIVLSVICGWINVAFSAVGVRSGNGRHFALLTDDQRSGCILWTTVSFTPGIMSFTLPKLAVVALLSRLMNPSKQHLIFMWSMTGLCMANLFVCVYLLFTQCTPSRSQWDFSVTKKSCRSPFILVDYAIWTGAFSAFVDLYLAVYPSVVLAKLQINIKKKIALSVALGIGSIATVVAIYKTTRLPALASADFSYDTSDIVIWTSVEGSTIIIASCIPILQPLLDMVLGRRALSSNASSKRHQYQKHSSSRTGHLHSSDNIEMSRRHNMKKAKQFEDDLTLTTRQEKEGSQESILAAAQAQAPLPAHPKPARRLSAGIMRTDEVTVQYEIERDTDREYTSHDRWKAV